MDKRKVLCELDKWTADPFKSQLSMKLIDLIENESPMGKILIQLLEYAENGNFK